MLLDRFLPLHHVQEQHATEVDAPAQVALAAARETAPRDLTIFLALMAVRSLPGLVRGRAPGLALRRPIVDQFVDAGFVVLADEPDEFVVGAVGRFWRPSGSLRQVRASEFSAFSEPGWAKAAVNFRVDPDDGRVEVSTETRVLGTDDAARRSFLRYWRVIHPGSALIRRAWLRSVRRRAER